MARDALRGNITVPSRMTGRSERSRPGLSLENAARARGARRVAGVDEVGRGPWAGPVVACAVCLTIPPPEGLDDSKRLPPARRAALAVVLAGADHGFGAASVAEIDAAGIRAATHLAMARAVAALAVPPDHLLIDGNDPGDWAPCSAETVVRGDSRSASIAAASVLAKVRRDGLMAALADRHPGYGWETNMGYGTAAHSEGLRRLGATRHHRRSFAPIRALLRGSP